MNPNSYSHLLFLSIAVCLFWALPRQGRKWFVLAASLVAYVISEGLNIGIPLAMVAAAGAFSWLMFSRPDRKHLWYSLGIGTIVAILAFHEPHRVVQQRSRFAGRENRDDMRVLQPRENLNFAAKALHVDRAGNFGGEHFHDDGAAERRLACDEKVAHASAAKLTLDDEILADTLLELLRQLGHRPLRPELPLCHHERSS